MDERGYVSQALLDRLRDDGVEFRVLGEDVTLAVTREALPGMPGRVARLGQDFDLHLVQLARVEHERWQFVLAWSDEVGRPSFLTVKALAHYYRAGRRLLRSEELLGGAPDALFLYGLAEAIEDQAIDEARGAWLNTLWHSDPRAAIERIGRFWRQRRDIRLLAQGAKQARWQAVRAALPALRRTLHRAVWPDARAVFPRLKNLVQPRGATVAFVGFENSFLRERVERELAPAFPAGLTTIEQDYSQPLRGADVAVLFDPPDSYRPRLDELIAIERKELLSAAAAKVERGLLRWLERRVERRNPDTVVGANPLAARILQFACRHNIPVLADFMGTLLNCGIYCRLRSPILMPHPY